MKKLSIIIPYYNGGEYTKKLIECLAPQVTKEVEVILVDDGSKEPFKTTEKWLKVIHKENGGVSAARNAGIDKATGEYITFIDHDDLVSDKYIKTILEKIDEGFDYLYMSWKTLPGGWQCDVKLNSVDDKFPEFNLCVWNRVYKRSLVGDVRFNENKAIAEDAEFIRKVHEQGKKAFISDYMYYYRTDHPDTLTKRFSEGKVAMRRVVYYYDHVTKDMTGLLDEFKKEDETAEVMLMTNQNDIPELEQYAMVIKPMRMRGTELRGEPTSLFEKIEIPVVTQVCIYAEAYQAIGGIETWLYNFCTLMKDKYDILVLYDAIDPKQLARLIKLVPCMKVSNKRIICDTLILNRITQKDPEQVTYKQKYRMIHTCFMAKEPHSIEPDGNIFVSDEAKRTFGIDGEVIHNMTVKPQRSLLLVSATRLTFEKGGERMIALAKALNNAGIPFQWLYFTYQPLTNAQPGMIHMTPTLNLEPFLRQADYVVQLSDCEAFCYTLVEALELGTPVITTPIGVLDELKIKDGVNGYVVPFDMQNIDAERFLTIPEFEYKWDNEAIIKKWRKVLGNTKKKQDYHPDAVTVRCTRSYFDIGFQRNVQSGEIVTMTLERAKTVCEAGFVEVI